MACWPCITGRWAREAAAFRLWPGRQLACRRKTDNIVYLTVDVCVRRGFAHGACRLEEAQEAAAGLREQLTEARRHLREVMDEEKEHKKKRRAAALALATVRACCTGHVCKMRHLIGA